ncbi:biosynthetic peptidoglycan transglycosylase [Paludicola sp. MB14-C6]|uniref:biosynthetic peptidoglycan transglycosylase n=1 Tax=Paludihabitans sp. MB14-C6 TaxID=3070656 RepID=UPI0027DCBBFB|nr:biosynthetic peptidoglycan transglycosylase [Paludicola sp. MB14-C6]WMJ22510.1 biosynthetic peptidoglycan transglycosylase [Paludicola sp. MB14-C6]
MRKKISYFISIVLLAAIVVIAICITPIICDGYHMYKKAITSVSLNEVITKVRNDDSYIKLDDISDEYLKAVVQSEDKRFYYHIGIDPIATVRAFYNNIKSQSFLQGGSTITQQLAKNLYFSFEKKMDRKVAELFVAFDLERLLTKDEILELYCNVTYFGQNCVGLKEAANHYYGVEPKALSTKQAAALAHALRSPNSFNPKK